MLAWITQCFRTPSHLINLNKEKFSYQTDFPEIISILFIGATEPTFMLFFILN